MTEVLSGRTLACGRDLGGRFGARAWFDDPFHVVVMCGDLDLASRAAAGRACTSPDHLDVIVEMAGLVFMDCAGYGALVASRTMLARRGGSLELMNPHGEPLRLLSLIDQAQGSVGFVKRDGSWSRPSVSAHLR